MIEIWKKLGHAPYNAHNILYKRAGFGSAGFFGLGWAPSSPVFTEENMRNTFQKLMGCVATSARKIVYNQPGLGSAGLLENFGAADLSSAKFDSAALSSAKLGSAALRSANFGARFMMLAAISLSLTLAGCDTGGGSGGDSSGNGGGGTPTCTGNQILQDGSCEACTAPQYPNADRTACVSSCPTGQIKLTNKPTCETEAACTGDEVLNPSDNTCFEPDCEANEIADTTVTPPGCITEVKCRQDSGKLVSANGEACIATVACTSVANQFINESGNCEACTGNTPVVNIEEKSCISVQACQSLSDNRYSVLDGSQCVTDAACQDMAGHVATADGDCEQCTGDDSIRNMEKTACMSASDCQSLSDNAFSVLDDAECITDAACVAESGRVATTDGVCQTCTGDDSIRNMEKTACMSESECQDLSSNAFSVLNGSECITDAACQDMAGHISTSDGVCMECTGNTNVRNVDKTACITATDCHKNLSTNPNSILGDDCITDMACIEMSDHVAQYDGVCQECEGDTSARNLARTACGVDSDSDGVIDSEDAFPADNCAGLDSDSDGFPDSLVDDCTTTLTADIDDDNDGLIEIASYAELQNMRYDLSGASYKTSAAASPLIAGAPESATGDCTTAVGYHVDATGAASLATGDVPDGSTLVSVYLCGYELTADIDANASCPNYDGSNGDDLTPDDNDDSNADDCGSGQSAWVPVGDCSIDLRCGGNTPNSVYYKPFTGILEGNGHRISNLYYKANANHGGLFGYADGASIRNLGLSAAYIDTGTNDEAGAFVGRADNSSISNSYATGRVLGNDYIGGLVGRADNSAISASYAAGSTSGNDYIGGLVGYTVNSSISNSYAAGSTSGTDQIGGLVGRLERGGSISNSYAAGSALGNNHVSGLAGVIFDNSSISNSYAAGSTSGNNYVGGLTGAGGGFGPLNNIMGKNYYVDADGMNGIGFRTCADTVCIRAGAADDTDEQRRAWLQATLDESTANDANPAGLGWDGSIWGNFTTAGEYPCLKNMPKGAPVCE